MGISDYIWPFEKKFSKIPCAREASIAALLGGPGFGVITFMVTNRAGLAYKTTLYSGLAVLWITFGMCRYEYQKQKNIAEQFTEAYKAGRIE